MVLLLHLWCLFAPLALAKVPALMVLGLWALTHWKMVLLTAWTCGTASSHRRHKLEPSAEFHVNSAILKVGIPNTTTSYLIHLNPPILQALCSQWNRSHNLLANPTVRGGVRIHSMGNAGLLWDL
jgi:hypothetical protein